MILQDIFNKALTLLKDFPRSLKGIPEFISRVLSARGKIAGIPLNALAALTILLPSCTSRFEMLNTNPNQVTAEQMEANNYRVGTKIVSMQSLVIPVEEHMYQFNESLTGGPFAGYIGSTVDTWLTRFELLTGGHGRSPMSSQSSTRRTGV